MKITVEVDEFELGKLFEPLFEKLMGQFWNRWMTGKPQAKIDALPPTESPPVPNSDPKERRLHPHRRTNGVGKVVQVCELKKQGLTHAEIAAKVDLGLGSVYQYLSKGHKLGLKTDPSPDAVSPPKVPTPPSPDAGPKPIPMTKIYCENCGGFVHSGRTKEGHVLCDVCDRDIPSFTCAQCGGRITAGQPWKWLNRRLYHKDHVPATGPVPMLDTAVQFEKAKQQGLIK
jgi:hypothetical protein